MIPISVDNISMQIKVFSVGFIRDATQIKSIIRDLLHNQKCKTWKSYIVKIATWFNFIGFNDSLTVGDLSMYMKATLYSNISMTNIHRLDHNDKIS